MLVFETKDGKVVRLNPHMIICLMDNLIVTNAAAWAVTVSDKDWLRIVDEYTNWAKYNILK